MQVDDAAECRPAEVRRCRLGGLTAPGWIPVSKSAGAGSFDMQMEVKTFSQVGLQDGDVSLPQSGVATGGDADCLRSHSRPPPAII